jgi:hypothetical protein
MIDAGHFDTQTAYAAVNTLRLDDQRPHIFRTHDGGKTWTEIVSGMEDAGAANAVREDPDKRGLLYASTERGVYVSFDDGARWHALQQNLPRSSARDIIVKDDDLAVATHGRGFWILDDITPLRQLDAAALERDAVLFKPTTAWRVRWNTSTDMPWPKEEAVLPNPPDGVSINYYLKSAGDLAGGGRGVRRRRPTRQAVLQRGSSVGHTRPGGRGGAAVLVQATTATGDDGRHASLDLGRALPAVVRWRRWWSRRACRFLPCLGWPRPAWDTMGGPGTYTVKLTVDGKSYSQPITVKQDPRVKTPAASCNRCTRTRRLCMTRRWTSRQLERRSPRCADRSRR